MQELIEHHVDTWKRPTRGSGVRRSTRCGPSRLPTSSPFAEAHGRGKIGDLIPAAHPGADPGLRISLAGPVATITAKPASPGAWVRTGPNRSLSASTSQSPTRPASWSASSASSTSSRHDVAQKYRGISSTRQ